MYSTWTITLCQSEQLMFSNVFNHFAPCSSASVQKLPFAIIIAAECKAGLFCIPFSILYTINKKLTPSSYCSTVRGQFVTYL